MKRSLIIVFAFIWLFVVAGFKVQAADFKASYLVVYDFNEDGNALVTQTQTITNLSERFFAGNYKITLHKIKASEVKAQIGGKDLSTTTKTLDGGDGSEIQVNLGNPVLGEGSKLTWALSYQTKDIAHKFGSIWELSLPKTGISETLDSYTVILKVPKEFGPLQSISPQPSEKQTQDGKQILTFNSPLTLNQPVAASFGKLQIYNFRLLYELENTSWMSIEKEIALPPDVYRRQQVFINKISPAPKNLRQDRDGNYLATYKLSPQQILQIQVIGRIALNEQSLDSSTGETNLQSQDLKAWLPPSKYWQTKDPKIKEIAMYLKSQADSPRENARRIYEQVKLSLTYDPLRARLSSVPRLGAVGALQEGNSALCLEYVDLFVALARAQGIPAREIDGFAYPQDQLEQPLSVNLREGDFLHAWAEYFDPSKGWVPADPTWGDTSGEDYFSKLGSRHITLAIKGINPEYPLPAGAYKIEGSQKQVDISLSEDSETPQSDYNIKVKKLIPWKFWKIFLNQAHVQVKNLGNSTLYNLAGSGKNLLPQATISVYTPSAGNQAVQINYQKFDGERVSQPSVSFSEF